LDEGLTILAGLWSGELFRFNGKHNQINDICFLPKPLQTPRIPIWVCGTWSDKKAPFRRAAKWDGVIPICPASENRAISSQEVQDIAAYIIQHRETDNPFDIVVILWSEGEVYEKDEVLAYEQAGVTWWLEDLSTDRFSSVGEVRNRLRKGPPG
jgi:hypothetical protein